MMPMGTMYRNCAASFPVYRGGWMHALKSMIRSMTMSRAILTKCPTYSRGMPEEKMMV